MGVQAVSRRYWRIPVRGFDDQIAVGETAGKARYAVFQSGRDAGYFDGPDGFRRFLECSCSPIEISQDDALAIVGRHRVHGET